MANKDRATVQSGLDDLLGNVIRSDRQKAGRTQRVPDAPAHIAAHGATPSPVSPDYDNHTSHIDIQDYDNMTDTQSGTQTDGLASVLAPVQADKRTAVPKKRAQQPQSPAHPEESASKVAPKRHQEAAAMAATNTMTVTLRIPAALNEWLDEYVHRSWPNKVKKQELVIEALQLLFVRRGRPGEEIIETELLPPKR